MALLAGPVFWMAGAGCDSTRGEILRPGDPRLASLQPHADAGQQLASAPAQTTTIPVTLIQPPEPAAPIHATQVPPADYLPPAKPAPVAPSSPEVTARPAAAAPDAISAARAETYIREIQANQQKMLRAVDDEMQRVIATQTRLDEMRTRLAGELARSPAPAPVATLVDYRVAVPAVPSVPPTPAAPSIPAIPAIPAAVDIYALPTVRGEPAPAAVPAALRGQAKP